MHTLILRCTDCGINTCYDVYVLAMGKKRKWADHLFQMQLTRGGGGCQHLWLLSQNLDLQAKTQRKYFNKI